MKRFTGLLIFVALLSGCATTDTKLKDFHSPSILEMSTATGENGGEINLLLESVDTVGIFETPQFRKGEVIFRDAIFPEILFCGEMSPGRLRWIGLAVDDDGHEHLAQLVYSRVSLNGKLIGTIMIDGTEKDFAGGARLGVFSTRFHFFYPLDMKETEIVVENREEIMTSHMARQKLIRESGIDISRLPQARTLSREQILSWNRVEGPRGVIYTPLTEEKFSEMARINPGYSHSQKWIASTNGSVSLNPYAMAINLLFEQIRVAGLKSDGWDFSSRIDRRQSAVMHKTLSSIKQSVINELNRRQQGGMP